MRVATLAAALLAACALGLAAPARSDDAQPDATMQPQPSAEQKADESQPKPGAEQKSEAMPSPLDAMQQDAVRKLIHDYLMDHPEVIVEAVQQLRDREHAEAQAEAQKQLIARKDEVIRDPATPVAGNPDGDVTVVEFFDYHCPYCKAMIDTVFDMVKQDGNIRFVMKELPILGPDSVFAARAAIAARQQGKYLEFHMALMHLNGPLSEASVMKVAASVGLDRTKLKADMNDPKIAEIIDADLDLAHALAIDGTPGWVIGDHVHSGAMSPEAFKQEVDEARKTKG